MTSLSFNNRQKKDKNRQKDQKKSYKKSKNRQKFQKKTQLEHIKDLPDNPVIQEDEKAIQNNSSNLELNKNNLQLNDKESIVRPNIPNKKLSTLLKLIIDLVIPVTVPVNIGLLYWSTSNIKPCPVVPGAGEILFIPKL